jgi:predicted DCC family thiol-disulfide oxidoreductase YuxK
LAELVPWGRELFSDQGVLPHQADSPLIHLFPNLLAICDAPAFVTTLLVAALGLSILFTIGCWDRAAAVGLWYVLACLHGRMPLIINPSLPYVGWVLLAHACLPPAPYGTWAARGRADPGSGWYLPPAMFAAAWVLMAVGYSYSGYAKLTSPSWLDGSALARVLDNPLARPGPLRKLLLALPSGVLHLATWLALGLELGFAPLAIFRRLRPWLWAAMLLMHLGLIVLIDFADLSLGMIMLHWFTFDPSWVRPQEGPTDMIFFDGHCGLCHRVVRFVLAEDKTGDRFRFAPLDSEAFRAVMAEAPPNHLSDSVIVRTADSRLLQRSAAVLHIARRLGGSWRVLGETAALLPPFVRDQLYDLVAWGRHRLFARPAQACPLVPAYLRKRFDPS